MRSNLVGVCGEPAGDDEALIPAESKELKAVSQLQSDNSKGGFGLQITQIRVLLGQTQDSLAKMLLTTRQSIVAIEKCNNPDELSDGMLFRLYYFVKELSENKYVTPLLRNISNDVLRLILDSIMEKAS